MPLNARGMKWGGGENILWKKIRVTVLLLVGGLLYVKFPPPNTSVRTYEREVSSAF